MIGLDTEDCLGGCQTFAHCVLHGGTLLLFKSDKKVKVSANMSKRVIAPHHSLMCMAVMGCVINRLKVTLHSDFSNLSDYQTDMAED